MPVLLLLPMGMFSTVEIAAMAGHVLPPAPRDYQLPTIFPDFSRASRIAFDIESVDPSVASDLGPGWRRNAYMVGFSLVIDDGKGNAAFSEYYPCAHHNAPNIDQNKLLEWLQDSFAFYQGEIVGANLLYDFDAITNRYGIIAPLAKFRDIQWAEPLIDENAYSYSLQTLAKKYLGEGKVIDEIKALYGPDVKEHMHEVHPGHMRAYGIGDAALPLRILRAQEKELRKQHLTDLYDLECRLMPMLLYMRRRGVRVDMQAAEQLHDKLQQRRTECLAAASKMVPARGFELTVENFGKPSVVCAAFDSLGIRYPKTEAGNPSIRDKWLDALEHPFGKMLASANRYDKALETFVNGYITGNAIGDRVHCEFHPLRSINEDNKKSKGTVSGRFSCGNPNLQNIPARDKEIGPLCRAMFISEPNMDWFSADYSQIEFREVVHAAYTLAQKQGKRPWDDDIHRRLQAASKARDMYISDPTTDFHNMVATLTGLERKYAKGINFGLAFTMGVELLALQIGEIDEHGKPTPKAISIMEQYHNNVPFVKAVSQAYVKMAKHDGYITTIGGRRAHFDMWEPTYYERGAAKAKAMRYEEAKAAYGEKISRAMTHKALNSYTQGGGADLIKTAMVQIWEGGLLDSGNMILSLTVHDELDGSIDRGTRGQELLAELKHIMENAIPISLPTTVEVATGKNWSETH